MQCNAIVQTFMCSFAPASVTKSGLAIAAGPKPTLGGELRFIGVAIWGRVRTLEPTLAID